MSASQNLNLKLENIRVWFKCVECQRCFYALPLLEAHFLKQHKDKRFVLPSDLPHGAREGKIVLMNFTSQEKQAKKEPLKQLETKNVAADHHTGLPLSPQNEDVKCDICKKSFKTQSALNFHFKKMHQSTNANNNIDKPETKMSPDLGPQQAEMVTNQKTAAVNNAIIKTTRERNIQRFANTNYVSSIKKNARFNYCQQSPFNAIAMRDFEAHIKLHQKGSTAVSCSLCGWFVRPQRLKVHWARRHSSVVNKN